MIQFCHISKSFKKDFWAKPFTALDNVSFNLEKGSITGFLGANGAGKTTLLKVLMGFIPYDSGEVYFSHELGPSRVEALKKIGFLPERPYFYPHLSGREFATYMGKLNNVGQSDLRDQITRLSKELGIFHALDQTLSGYSKGMLQRLGLMTSLLHRPELIILDEPLSGLDPLGRKDIKAILSGLAREGKTIFLSSHIVSDIEQVCQNVVVLERGQCIYDGKIEDLISSRSTSLYELTYSGDLTKEIEKILQSDFHGNLGRLVFEKENKEYVISALLHQGVDIRALEPMRPTLEEVIYNIKA